MLKKRLIPVLLLKDGSLVRSELFKVHQIIGDPTHEVRRFNQWNVDELIYLDISREEISPSDGGSGDGPDAARSFEVLDAVSKTCFMPLTWGGRIRSVGDMRECFRRGADKITINSEAVRNPGLIAEGARLFGSQAIVVSIDIGRDSEGGAEVVIDGGTTATGLNPVDWAVRCASEGAGEILLQVIDRDGVGNGYDLELISALSGAVDIPLIACSGVGRFEDYAPGIEAGASAVAAANLWHFKELSDRMGKKALAKAGVNVRV